MRHFKFRALVTLDPPAPNADVRRFPTGTHNLMIHAWRMDDLSSDKYFPTVIACDAEHPLEQGERAVVTFTVEDDDALQYLAPGQPFTIFGGSRGHGVISRREFTDGQPS
ncbi:MAG TPA: hypothetical protein VEV63_13750 [Streptosporangiaceae bacterium]|nr:hypothetical protein [Streptosporangiaceae bacterium]